VTIARSGGNGTDYNFRKMETTAVSTIGYSGLFYKSVSVTVNPRSNNVDLVVGAAYAGFGIPPSDYLSFYQSASAWNGDNTTLTFNVYDGQGMIAKAFVALDEVSLVNGTNVVQNFKLAQFFWSTTDSNVGNGGLRHLTVSGKPVGSRSNFTVSVTFVVSDVLGVLNVTGSPIVTPKSIESMITISNFPYVNAANQVRLTTAVASAEATLQITGTLTHLVAGQGTPAYITFNSVAEVNGKPAVVHHTNVSTNGLGFGNNNLAGQVSTMYQAAAQFTHILTSFPAGAAQIVFDPVLSVGSIPPEMAMTDGGQNGGNGAQNGVAALIPSLMCMIVAKLFF